MGTRLHTIAELVPEGVRVADIGTDHARLLVHVLTHRHASLAIGVEFSSRPSGQKRRAHPLRAAHTTLARLPPELAARTALREGDGLGPIARDEVDAIVIAGVGARTIAEIVDADRGRIINEGTTLVLQPTNHWRALRRWLATRAMFPMHERIVDARGRPHYMIAARPGAFAWTDDDIAFGPLLRRAPCPAYRTWLAAELRRMHAIASHPAAAPQAREWHARVAALVNASA